MVNIKNFVNINYNTYLMGIGYKNNGKEIYATEKQLPEMKRLIHDLKKLLPIYNPIDAKPGSGMDVLNIYNDICAYIGLVVLMPRHNHRINYIMKRGL
jgi:hypothetical protein